MSYALPQKDFCSTCYVYLFSCMLSSYRGFLEETLNLLQEKKNILHIMERSMRILVVEDNLRLADTLADALRAGNYMVDIANDGLQ